MNEHDIAVIKDIREHLRAAVNGFSAIQTHFQQRNQDWDESQPHQRLMEQSMWVGLAQCYGHITLHIYGWLDQLITTYYEKKAVMEASPAPPPPDEGEEIPQTPMPNFMDELKGSL